MTTSQRRALVFAIVLLALLLGALGVRRLTGPSRSGAGLRSPTVIGREQPDQSGAESDGSKDSLGHPQSRVSRLRAPNDAQSQRARTASGVKRSTDSNSADPSSSDPLSVDSLEKAIQARVAHHKVYGYSPDSPALPEIEEGAIRAMVGRTKNDMRSMATGLESYFVDDNRYPISTTDTARMQVSGVSLFGQVPGPQNSAPEQAGSVTTPVAYMTSYFQDVFSMNPADTFGYYSPNNNGWILFSPGPDGKFDLDWSVYDPSISQPSPELFTYAYDPTNGVTSGGDIWRVKQ